MIHKLTSVTINLLFFVTISSILSCNSEHKSQEEQKPPNVIFILADDLGYGDIEPYGQKIIQTPHLRKLADDGIVFTDHYAGNTVCAPSRCSLLTGLHPGSAFVRGNKQYPPSGQLPLPDTSITVSQLFKEAGYSTAMIGKWGLGNTGNSGDPFNFGWDFYYGYLDQVLAHNYFPEYLLRNGEKEYLQNEVFYLPDSLWHEGLGSYSTQKKDYSHDLFMNEAVNFIQEHKTEPFFLYLPITIPHDNGEALSGQRMEIPDYGMYEDSTQWSSEMKGYAAMITKMDHDIGRIIQLLEDLNIRENTLLIFTSDNGPLPDEEFTTYFNSNGPFRGGKRDLYEGGIRIPFIASWPGTIKGGQSTSHISAFWDFFPTVCELLGMESPGRVDGISYLPVLLGEDQESHDYLYWESPLKGFMTAVRKGDWKAVSVSHGQELELYRLDQDHSETINVASQYPDVIAEMKDIIKEAHHPSSEFPRPDER